MANCKPRFFLAALTWVTMVSMGTTAASAHAEFYFEPTVGVGLGKLSGDIINSVTPNDSTSVSVTAPSVGARLGVFYDYVYLGIDGYASYFQIEELDPALFTAVGLGMGFTLEYLPLRWYIAADLSNKGQLKKDTAKVDLSSSGFRGGIGYYLTAGTVVNVEYQSVSHKIEGTEAKVKQSIVFVTLSFPMTFSAPEVPWRIRYEK